MGKTSTTVKNRWNVKSYDRLAINVPKGRRNDIEAHAQSKGLSVNGLVGELLRADLNMTEEEWRRKPDAEQVDAGVALCYTGVRKRCSTAIVWGALTSGGTLHLFFDGTKKQPLLTSDREDARIQTDEEPSTIGSPAYPLNWEKQKAADQGAS